MGTKISQILISPKRSYFPGPRPLPRAKHEALEGPVHVPQRQRPPHPPINIGRGMYLLFSRIVLVRIKKYIRDGVTNPLGLFVVSNLSTFMTGWKAVQQKCCSQKTRIFPYVSLAERYKSCHIHNWAQQGHWATITKISIIWIDIYQFNIFQKLIGDPDKMAWTTQGSPHCQRRQCELTLVADHHFFM